MRSFSISILVAGLAACAATPPRQATPQQRTQAAGLLLQGATMRDVATQLSLSDDDARWLVRTTIVELHHRYVRAE